MYFFHLFSSAYLNGKAHLLSLTFKILHDWASDIFPGLSPTSSCLLFFNHSLQTQSPRKCVLIGSHPSTIQHCALAQPFFCLKCPFHIFLLTFLLTEAFSKHQGQFPTPLVCGTSPIMSLSTLPGTRSQSVLPLCSHTEHGPLLQCLQFQVLAVHSHVCSPDEDCRPLEGEERALSYAAFEEPSTLPGIYFYNNNTYVFINSIINIINNF